MGLKVTICCPHPVTTQLCEIKINLINPYPYLVINSKSQQIHRTNGYNDWQFTIQYGNKTINRVSHIVKAH